MDERAEEAPSFYDASQLKPPLILLAASRTPRRRGGGGREDDSSGEGYERTFEGVVSDREYV